VYDPATGKFTPTGSMSVGRCLHTATLLRDGRVLVAGGWNGEDDFASAELYDPATGKFTPTEPMTEGFANGSATLLADGRVVLVGNPGSSSDWVAEAYWP
jgi:hypothetical protein